MGRKPVEQRWRRGRDRWVQPDGPRFVPARYEVDAIDESMSRPFIETHHYAHSYPAARFAYGLFDTWVGELVGVAVYAVPVNVAVLTGPFPALTPYEQSIELSRLVLLDEVPFNARSRGLSPAATTTWRWAASAAWCRSATRFPVTVATAPR